jgi:hypothetical protein
MNSVGATVTCLPFFVRKQTPCSSNEASRWFEMPTRCVYRPRYLKPVTNTEDATVCRFFRGYHYPA